MKILKILLPFVLAAAALAQTSPPPAVAPGEPPASHTDTSAKPPAAREPKQDEQTNDPAAVFKVNVKLVNVFATVTDNNGAPIASLKKDDFKISEDGVEQKIAVFNRESELPLSIVMGIDASLSTRKDLRLELESARKFAHAIVRPIDALSVYAFSEIVHEVVPFTSDLKQIDRGIVTVRTGAATALYDALYLGSEALLPRKGRKVMVVITDGGDTASRISYAEAVRAAQTAETILYAVIMVPIEASAGRDTGGEHALIQLSRDTGGKHYYATSLGQLEEVFHQISDELRTQYLIAYYPSQRTGNEFRRISIDIDPATNDAPDAASLKVRHRTGYYTSKLK
ncbi:MAG TPA: VWA domain-containing protein [Clostridia bacterium]|nr:VWA domain-containing protein [Clostridia bacterium]